uniref:Aluminum-activated malate transporter n=1 Tax=Chenopodium quinoa TaxID=63459 RepID=A0A803LXN1_CHEQI
MLMSKYDKIKTDISHISQLTKKLAKDDPRRIIHSIKVGFAITLVSLFYYFDPLYQGFGVNAMWAVLTAVVVFEFSVGATLGKGVNRALATIIGGMSGFGAHKLSTLSGNKFVEPFLLGLFVFITGFGLEYFNTSSDINSDDEYKTSIDAINNVLNSKNNIDTLLNYARWEFRHGRFKRGHPWTQYQKIGELARHCACRAEALHGLLYSQVQASNEVKAKFQEPCMKISAESGNALNELSIAIKKMNKPSKAKPHLQKAKQAAENLNLMLKSNIWKNLNLSDVTPAATVANLLADVVSCTEDIAEAVQELASLAKFKDVKDVKVSPQIEKAKLTNQGSTKRRCVANNHVILIEIPSPTSSPRVSVPRDPPSLAMAQQNAE